MERLLQDENFVGGTTTIRQLNGSNDFPPNMTSWRHPTIVVDWFVCFNV
jgi:hypothetical protein